MFGNISLFFLIFFIINQMASYSSSSDLQTSTALISRQQSLANFIDTGAQSIQELDHASLYMVKEHVQKWKGAMYNLKQKWFLISSWIKHYSPYVSTFNGEQQVFIECSNLVSTFNHMSQVMACKLNDAEQLYGAHLLHGYNFPVEGIYAKMGKSWRVFDELKVDITDSFQWKVAEQHQKLRFLFEIYGYFTFEGGNKEKMVKVVSKIVQIQRRIVPDNSDEAAEYDNNPRASVYNICMF